MSNHRSCRKYLGVVILGITLGAGAQPAQASSALCGAMGDFGLASWDSYNKGATKNELYSRARGMAGGDSNIYALLKLTIDTAIKEKTAGDARRKTVRVCEQIGG